MMEFKQIRNTANSAIALIAEVSSCKNFEPFKINEKKKLKKKTNKQIYTKIIVFINLFGQMS